jgi:hypothetical protein
MPPTLQTLPSRLLTALAERGPLSSADLQQLSGKSQPTVSRALRELGGRVVALGQGRSTRYGLPHPIRGLPAQQPLWWTDAQGDIRRFGTLTLLTGDYLHVAAEGIEVITQGQLPWFLAPLRLQGFLGRAWAQHLGLDGNPEQWPLELQFHAALRVDDHPGAISIGDLTGQVVPADPIDPQLRTERYEQWAADVTVTLPAGSSAGGEQSKFLSGLVSGERLIVKFSPPRGTPFGERWHELLHAEALALQVLAEHGFEVAASRVIEGRSRSYLESTRVDRIGAHGRRHTVALEAVHQAFVGGPRQHWAATCDALVTQRRLRAEDAATARCWLEFGRLIGNSDMHFGNLSLWADEPARARFTLAPLYDMLPMCWRPDAFMGLSDYAAFEPLLPPRGSAALPLAQSYWQRLAEHAAIGMPLRTVAGKMARQLQRHLAA